MIGAIGAELIPSVYFLQSLITYQKQDTDGKFRNRSVIRFYSSANSRPRQENPRCFRCWKFIFHQVPLVSVVI